MVTKQFGVRVPEAFTEELVLAKQLTGAISMSDLLCEVLRYYLEKLSLLGARAERLKARLKLRARGTTIRRADQMEALKR